MRKSSMLQRQLRLNAQEITNAQERINCFKGNRKHAYEKGDSINAELLSRFVGKDEKYVNQLSELQVFLKKELSQTLKLEALAERFRQFNECLHVHHPGGDDYKHAPQFMAEAPPAELGSFVQDEA